MRPEKASWVTDMVKPEMPEAVVALDGHRARALHSCSGGYHDGRRGGRDDPLAHCGDCWSWVILDGHGEVCNNLKYSQISLLS